MEYLTEKGREEKELAEVEKSDVPGVKISLESLSGLIFGLALSIGAIFLIFLTYRDSQTD